MSSPSPTTSVATLRSDLAGAFMEFDLESSRQGFVGMGIMRPIAVSLQADEFGVIPLEAALEETETLRAPGTGYAEREQKFTTLNYSTKDHGAVERLDDLNREKYRHIIDGEMFAVQRAMDRVLRGHEKRVADAMSSTTTWTGASLTTGAGTAWSTYATATPIVNVEGAVQKVYDNTGHRPNAVVMGWKAFRNARLCDEVKEALSAQGAGESSKASNITASKLAELFDVKHVFVADAVRNTANSGQSPSLGGIWPDSRVMVCRVAETDDIAEPCVGRSFVWDKFGGGLNPSVFQYRDEDAVGDKFRVNQMTDEVVVYPELGHLITGVL